mmetsp:Transcript_15571/g.59172  ORF Transcript_15571/g.59172 Transcript_15571/m.59172 type:complete len:423 (-) Transcript_15571:368-1636(-)
MRIWRVVRLMLASALLVRGFLVTPQSSRGSPAVARKSSLNMVKIPFPLPLKYTDQIAALAGAWKYTGPIPPFLSASLPGYAPVRETTFLSLYENGTFREAPGKAIDRSMLRGRWGVAGGRLVLAVERVMSPLVRQDTMFEGPMWALDDQDSPDAVAVTNAEGAPVWTARARVRKGMVYVGRFTYPPSHPRFLEDPMWSPEDAGSFDLVQVLGNGVEMEGVKAKYRPPPGPPPTKYSKKDLSGRWVLKVIPMAWTGARSSLMLAELKLHTNGTWESTAGLGSDTTLRGRWGIFADAPERIWREDEAHDKIWVLVTRFGLGRNASYSCGVFSEGPFLNQDDDKMYIGSVREVTRLAEVDVQGSSESKTDAYTETLEAKGVVMLGLGLEPVSVGRFAMTRLEASDDEDEAGDGQSGYWPSLIGRV